MPYSRSYNSPYLSGSPYPTGRSPLVLDLENKINAVTQQIIDNRKQEIKEKNLEIDKNEKLIIDALDFEPLAEAGQKWQLENAKEIEGFTDRWTKKLYEQDYKLSTPDKIQLNKEKREIERKRGIAETDIQTLAEIKKEIAKGEKSAYDVNETAQKIKEYQENGLVGSGGAINLAVMKKIPFDAAFKERWESRLKNKAKSFTGDVEIKDRVTGEIVKTKTNEPSVNEAIEAMQLDPEWQEFSPEQQQQLINDIKLEYTQTQSDPRIVAAAKAGSGSESFSSGKYPNLKTKQQEIAADNYNEWAERVYQGDEAALQALKGAVYKTFRVTKNNFEFDTIDTATGKSKTVSIPRNLGKKYFKENLWNYAPDDKQQGLTNISPAVFVKEEWDLAAPVQKAELAEVRNIRTLVNDIPQKYEKLNDFKKDQDKIVKELTDTILKGKYIPDDFKTRKGRGGAEPGITFNEITYDIREPEQKEAFLNAVLKEAGMEQKKDEENKVEFTPEQEDAISKLLELNPDFTREEIIKELGY